MYKYIFYTVLAIMIIFMLTCGKNDDIVGSDTDTIENIQSTRPYLLADGLSTALIVVTVHDSSGKPAKDLPIYFETTAGAIIDQANTNSDGKAYATLRSIASETDIVATVTATVLDTNLLLPKRNAIVPQIELQVAGFKNPDKKTTLGKSSFNDNNTASIDIDFVGITFKGEIDADVIPADGISKANVKITIKETTSKKAVSSVDVYLAAAYGTIKNKIQTNEEGIAETNLTAYTEALTDTIYLEYGDLFTKTLTIDYAAPQISIAPEKSYLIADGTSKATFTISVKSQKNTPIVGAQIKFSATNGTISPSSAQTNSEGIATAQLTSTAEVDTSVIVIASLNTFSDTAYVSFIEPLLELTPSEGELAADGTSQLTFTASLFLPDNTPVVGAEINFSTSDGTITPAKGYTDSEGKASATLKSGYDANSNVIVMASFQDLYRTATVKFLSPIITLTPSEAKLLANGVSKQNFVATLVSQSNAPIPNAEIQFSTTNGTISQSMVTTDISGKAYTELRSSTTPDSNILVIAKFHGVADSSQVVFVESSSETGLKLSGETQLFRDGISSTEITAMVLDDNSNPVPNATLFFTSLYGDIPSSAITNESGIATVIYTPDVSENDAQEEITATVGSAVVTHNIQLLGLTMTMTAVPDSIPADGSSTSDITVQLKLTTSQMAVPGINIAFSTDLGYLATGAVTSAQGVANISLRSASQPGTATVTAQYGGFVKTVQVQFYLNSPQSMLLSADPNYIWVKETGNLEQTTITATVLGVQGEPIGHEVPVKFYLQNGPGGGAGFVVAGGEPTAESEAIMTSNGKAAIGFRAGTRSGTVEIRAELVNSPTLAAQTTNLIIRSGPPYIWIDPADPNNVVSHMTLTLDYFNLPGWSHLYDYNVSVLIGDKYNNPVELGTTVYFTTNGGVITTDIKTNERGMGQVVLASGQPRPYVCPLDPAFNPHTIENPNDPSIYLPIELSDYEGGEVTNSCGDTGENDGIAVILAYTHGRDQNGNEAKVWSSAKVIFGGAIAHYDVFVDPPVDTLLLGETAQIHIRVWDINGNPPSAGSSLKAKTTAGSLSAEDLMPDKETYGYGSTYFLTTLLNNLDPVDDEPGMAEVSVELNTPFGKISRAVYIYLRIL